MTRIVTFPMPHRSNIRTSTGMDGKGMARNNNKNKNKLLSLIRIVILLMQFLLRTPSGDGDSDIFWSDPQFSRSLIRILTLRISCKSILIMYMGEREEVKLGMW